MHAGIIVLFVLCHIGEMLVSVYEMVLYYMRGSEDRTSIEFPNWVRNLIVINHILIVANSSLNFAIYCKDLVFRQCLRKVYRAIVCNRFLQNAEATMATAASRNATQNGNVAATNNNNAVRVGGGRRLAPVPRGPTASETPRVNNTTVTVVGESGNEMPPTKTSLLDSTAAANGEVTRQEEKEALPLKGINDKSKDGLQVEL